MLKAHTAVRITEVGASRWDSLQAGDEGYLVADQREGKLYTEVQVPSRDAAAEGDSWPLVEDEFEVID